MIAYSTFPCKKRVVKLDEYRWIRKRYEEKILHPTKHKVDKHSFGYKKKTEAITNSTQTLLKLLDSAKDFPAQYLLFTSWFAFPKTIVNVVKRKLDVIYIMMIAHTTIVFIRYAMLALEARNATNPRRFVFLHVWWNGWYQVPYPYIFDAYYGCFKTNFIRQSANQWRPGSSNHGCFYKCFACRMKTKI